MIWHITWDKNGTPAKPVDLVPFDKLVEYFTRSGQNAAPHLLWDPFTGRIAQFYPANSRSKSVVDTAGGTRTNRTTVLPLLPRERDVVCDGPGHPGQGPRQNSCLGAESGSSGRLADGLPDLEANRSEHTWETEGGHYGRSQTSENQHTDPGPMPKWPTTTSTTPKPGPPAFPGRSAFGPGKSNTSILLLGQQLVRKSYGSHHRVGPSRDWGEADRLNIVDSASNERQDSSRTRPSRS
ncbi:peptidoglycan-binding protein [Streptomyces sp. NPDC002769]|uniref:peptidoglycan-binding protein n=1 Tax=Streptomyces sp. NPDC002769 TaxID=3154542 RepID=UPI00331E1253